MFVGRGEELAALEAAVAQAREGRGSAVLVAAEAGMGKTRLISEFGARAEGAGATVLVGECVPVAEGELPYAPIVGALRSLVRDGQPSDIEALAGHPPNELAWLLPELGNEAGTVPGGVPAEGAQARLFEQLLTVLTTASWTAPLVLVVEDLHWADRSTRDFLAFLVRRTRRERVVLIASYRTHEPGSHHALREFLYELERSGQASRLELAPFTRPELHDQVEAILGAAPERGLVDRLLARSEGNPFFTEQLLAFARGGAGSLPESLRDALLLRVEAQPPSVQRVLRIAAVAGRTVGHLLLADFAGLPEEELAAALRDAVASHLLVEDAVGTGYTFRHALVREAIYADLLPVERRALHLELARALSNCPELAGTKPTAAAEVSYHWHAAGQLAEALVASVRAGMAAEAVHALGEALMHYERALAIWDTASHIAVEPPLVRTEVLRRASQAANLTGAMERAIELACDALERTDEQRDPVGAALAHERLGCYLWTAGHDHDDALREYRRAVELVPPDPPSEKRAFVLAAEAQLLMLSGRIAESTARCQEALEIARQVEAEAVQAHLLNTLSGNLYAIGDSDGAAAAAAQARSIASRLVLAEELYRGYLYGSSALEQLGRIQESIALAREGIEESKRLGADRHHGDYLRAANVATLFLISRWEEADALVHELLDREPSGVAAASAYSYLARLEAERGEYDRAARAVTRAGEIVGRSGRFFATAALTEAQATIHLWTDRPGDAAKAVAESLEPMRGGVWLFTTASLCELASRAHADLAATAPTDLCLRSHQLEAVDALLHRLDALIAEVTGAIPPRVAASRATLVAERSRIDDMSNGDAWDEAAQRWEAVGNRYQAAYARWRQAEALLTAGDRRVDAIVRAAAAVARTLRARPLLTELERLARRARIDLDEGDRPAPTPNAALRQLQLTAREIEVLALLVDGLTNREIAARLFISNKTASVHVSHLLRKLGVPTRTAAAAAAHRLGIAPAS